MNFSGKVVLVADVGSAVGSAITNDLIEAGATILAVGEWRSDEARHLQDTSNIIDTGVAVLTKDTATPLAIFIRESIGKIDSIILNNYAGPILNPEVVADSYSLSVLDAFQYLHPLLKDGSSIVLCPQIVETSAPDVENRLDLAVAMLGLIAKHWANVLMARDIRVNVVAPSMDHTLFHPTSATRSNESPQNLATTQVVANVLFMSSELSRPWTGTQLSLDGRLRSLSEFNDSILDNVGH